MHPTTMHVGLLFVAVALCPLATAAFDSNNYPRSQILHPDLSIFWRIAGNSIHLAIQVDLNVKLETPLLFAVSFTQLQEMLDLSVAVFFRQTQLDGLVSGSQRLGQ